MNKKQAKKLILASASPRRKELLENLGYVFQIIPADIDETINGTKSPKEIVKELALQKATYVADSVNYPAIIIGSDTIVVVDNTILGKPENNEDACNMLKLLSGRSHQVISGIAIIDNKSNKNIVDSISSDVYFRTISKEEITSYVKTGEPMDKAGAYAIQGLASTFIEKINGCYNNIVGLPIFKVTQALKEFDLDILEINAKD